jgi:hypothetical protein
LAVIDASSYCHCWIGHVAVNNLSCYKPTKTF